MHIVFLILSILSLCTAIVALVTGRDWLSGVGFGSAAATLISVVCYAIL